jgi:hypothetical protein
MRLLVSAEKALLGNKVLEVAQVRIEVLPCVEVNKHRVTIFLIEDQSVLFLQLAEFFDFIFSLLLLLLSLINSHCFNGFIHYLHTGLVRP